MEYSIGLIKGINENNYNIRHSCDSRRGSSGGPIINSTNFQVIGIHKGGEKGKFYNVGILLKEPIERFNEETHKKEKKDNNNKEEYIKNNEGNLIKNNNNEKKRMMK